LSIEGDFGRLVEIPFSLGGAHSRIGMTYLTSARHSPHHDELVEMFRRHALHLIQRVKPDVGSTSVGLTDQLDAPRLPG
jgi:hypothetical protein